MIGSLAAFALAGCAETNAPLPEPLEVLLVANGNIPTLDIIPVDQPAAAVQVPLGAPAGSPTGLAARDSMAVVVRGDADAVSIVDLAARAVRSTVMLPPGSGAAGAAMVDDSIVYVANAARHSVTRINIWTGDTAEVAVGTTPQGIAFVRGRLFVVNGNRDGGAGTAATPARPSWITVLDPVTNARAAGIDSIPLTGPGNAKFSVAGHDGLLYVVSPGDGSEDEGRLSIIDPVARSEIASFAGLGTAPGSAAADAFDRILVSSVIDGLMVFDTRTRTMLRAAGNGVPVPTNVAVAADRRGRIYAVEAGACALGSNGAAQVLDSTLAVVRTLPLGACPVAAAVTLVP